MKKKAIRDIQTKSTSELTKEVVELRKKVWQLRNDAVIGKLKNVREIRETRKHVARLLTRITALRHAESHE